MIEIQSSLAVTNKVLPFPCSLVRVRGYWDGAADAYLQLFDAAALPANDAVPTDVMYVQGDFAYEFAYPEGEPKRFKTGLSACFSSTKATKTIVTGEGNTGDLFIEIENSGFIPDGCSTAGDLTTGVSSLDVWLTAAGPKKLHYVEVNSLGGDEAYVWVLPTTVAGVAEGTKPVALLKTPSSNGTTYRFSFGGGLDVQEVVGGTRYKGCTLMGCASATELGVIGASTLNLKAWYK